MTISFKATSMGTAGVTVGQMAVDLVKQGAGVLFLRPGSSTPACTLTATQRKRDAGHDCGHNHVITTVAAARRVAARLAAELGPELNLAVVAHPSRLIVVDADNAPGVQAWEQRSGDGPTILTPGKRKAGAWVHHNGAHFVYELPADVDLPTDVGTLAHEDGYDIRWTGYSLVPPSVRSEGAYELVGDVLPAPAELITAIRQHIADRSANRSTGPKGANPTVAQWSRDTDWADIMARLEYEQHGTDRCGCPTWSRPGGANPKSAVTHEPALCTERLYSFLERHGPAHFYSTEAGWGLGGRTVTKLGVWAARYHGGDIKAAMTELGLAGPTPEDVREWVDSLSDADDAPERHLPESFWLARPALGHVRALARARMVAPDALLGAVLAHVVCSIGPHVQLPAVIGGRASLNLFVGVVGQTGQGKGAAVSAAAEMFPDPPFATVQPGTGEGLAAAYVQVNRGKHVPIAESALFDVAEIETMAKLAERKGTTLDAQLRHVFMGERLGFQNASSDRRLTVAPHSYRAAMIIGVQPEHAGTLLMNGAATGGTGGRFVWLDGSRDPGRVRGKTYPDPGEWSWAAPDGWGAYADPVADALLTPHRPTRIVIELPAAVEAQVRGTKEAGLIDGEYADTLDRHALLIRIKLAVGLMLLDGRTTVAMADWALAGVLLETSNHVRGYVLDTLASEIRRTVNQARKSKAADAKAAREAVHEFDIARVAERILVHLRTHKTPAGYCTIKCIKRDAVHSADRGHVFEALLLLERSNRAGRVTAKRGGAAWKPT